MTMRVIILRPDGSVTLKQTTAQGGDTSIVNESNVAGVYTMTLTPLSPDEGAPRPRTLSVTLADQGPLTPHRLQELKASAALKSGDDLASEWTQSALDRSAAAYGEAAQAWQRAADPAQAARAFLRQGTVHSIRGQYKEAMASYSQGLRLTPAATRLELRVDLLTAIAAVATDHRNQQEAEKAAHEAMILCRQRGYDLGRGRVLAVLGQAEFFFGQPDKAKAYLSEAMSIWTTTTDREGEALTLRYSSFVSTRNSNNALAFEDLSQALRFVHAIGNKTLEAQILADIGNYYLHVDELEHARDSYNASLLLLTDMGNVQIQAIVLDDYGFYLEEAGDATAPRLYERAASLVSQSSDPLLEGVVLSDLSRALITEGKPALSLQYAERELRIAGQLHQVTLTSIAMRDIGEAHMAAGDAELAVKSFRQAMDPKLLGEHSEHRANTGIELGRALERLGRAKEALEAYRESAELSHTLGMARPEAEARYRMASLRIVQGQLGEALDQLEHAVPLVEVLRQKVSMDDTRTRWFASFHSIYTLYIDVLMQLSAQRADPALAQRAYAVAEQSMARSFVDLLREARIDKGSNQDLVSEEASVRRLIAQETGKEKALLAAGRNSAAVGAEAARIADLHARSKELSARLKAQDPDYFDTPASAMGVEQAQALLGPDDLVLEYSLGAPRSYLWAISKSGFASYTLPGEDKLEQLVRRYRRAAVAPNPALQRYLDTGGAAEQVANAGEVANEEQLAAELGQTLLAPVQQLGRYKRVVVVADGTLHYLPFSVLALGRDDTHGAGTLPRLADKHEVSNAPSMTALAELRAQRAPGNVAGKGMVVFADPVFEADDPRLAPGHNAEPGKDHGTLSAKDSTHARSTRAHSDAGLPRLPGTRHEAEVIAAVAPQDSTRILMGFDASRNQATTEGLGNYGFIHFATHSVFDDERPDQSGVILSLYNRNGVAQDGYLRLRDIYNLKLSAQLVVLSACDTALGNDIKGEGIVGLTRGFIYAGAPRVVATLWRVDDDATSEFMKDFYHAIFEEHESPTAALETAQAEMRGQPRFRSPYYWGAFVIEGEWLPLNADAQLTLQTR